jgi:ADP-ribose pyrophosphatase YjhB (NUDIX family)
MRTNKNVRGMIKRDGKILLIHRFKAGTEYWTVPGGGVEDDETLEEALAREIKEEVGLKIISAEVTAPAVIINKDQFIYNCVVEAGEPHMDGPEAKANNENNRYILTWVPIEEAKTLPALYPEIVKELI